MCSSLNKVVEGMHKAHRKYREVHKKFINVHKAHKKCREIQTIESI